ncbi:hypothetical protein GCM10023195_21970 [Actinoallomurus liliacearum]|uniref:Uncharacterized protein n=1 Tax=Actinoallomurus liliacearum TaxID=1080073 RepID=A0ABP8TJN1_9ACTN
MRLKMIALAGTVLATMTVGVAAPAFAASQAVPQPPRQRESQDTSRAVPRPPRPGAPTIADVPRLPRRTADEDLCPIPSLSSDPSGITCDIEGGVFRYDRVTSLLD